MILMFYDVLYCFIIKDKTFEGFSRVLFSFHANTFPINYILILSCSDLKDRFVTCCFSPSFLISENSGDLW